ncbi:MAG TPA: hypothetical protein VKB78_13365 [Pirellulales bacterium]|nr:hypothetical protein [Pirellulales bacterium]
MSDQPVRIIKLGGSLLDDVDWPARFRSWLKRQSPMRNVLVVGGGRLADAVRRWDRIHDLSPSDSHWLAIDTMSVTSRLAAKLLPEAALTDDWSSVSELTQSDKRELALAIFDPAQFLRTVEPTLDGGRIPASWDVTSDSISARIGRLLSAAELVALKSCLPVKGVATIEQAAKTDYIDRAFPRFAAGIPRIRLVNLRDVDFTEAEIVA